jgi:hypothetical protein
MRCIPLADLLLATFADIYGRMISMTLGRPVVSAAQGPDPTPLPSELDESLFQSGQVRAAAISSVSAPPAMISFLVHSAKLFEIMQQILLAFYPDDSPSIALGPIDFSGFTEVFKIDAQLTSWLAATPRHLQFQHDQSPASADSAEERVFRRQALVMRNRYEIVSAGESYLLTAPYLLLGYYSHVYTFTGLCCLEHA